MEGITNSKYHIVNSNLFLDILYPIGSIYMSTSSTSPALLIGGEWQKIEDQFLLGNGDIYTANSTGGSSTHVHSTGNHTLTLAETPNHNHTVNSHSHVPRTNWYMIMYNYAATGNKGVSEVPTANYSGSYKIPKVNNSKTDWAGVDNTASTTSGTTGSGSNGAHNHGNTSSSSNLPPYLSIYMWQRIS